LTRDNRSAGADVCEERVRIKSVLRCHTRSIALGMQSVEDVRSVHISTFQSLNSSLRHEVARLIVWHVVTRPVAPSAVSYEDVREGNDPCRALGHGTHSLWTGA
jgi:hypothetical protein